MTTIWTIPIEHIGNLFYIVTLLVAALFLLRGHASGKINLWDLFTSTVADGKVYTDRRKVMEIGMFFVMTVSFYYFSVTKQLTDTYVGIYAATALGAAAWRDREQRLASQLKAPNGTSNENVPK